MLLALLRRYLRPYRHLVAVVVTLQLAGTLTALWLPTINASIIDDGVSRGDTAVIVRLGAVMLVITVAQVACSVGGGWAAARAGTGFGRDLRSALFHRVLDFSERETARFGTASLLTRTTNDARQIQTVAQLLMTVVVAAPLMCLGGLIMAVHQDAGLAWLLALSVPVLAVAITVITTRLLPIVSRMQALIDDVNRVMRDQLTGIRVIRAFTREHAERDRFDGVNRELHRTAVAAGNLQAAMLPVTTLTINGSSVALIWLGGLRIDAGRMQIGSLVAFLSYFMLILMSVLMATMVLAVLPRASVCAGRIREVLDTEPSLRAPDAPVPPPVSAGAAIRLSGVTFCYPGADRAVLRDVDLTVASGSTVAVVGGTGSGKSTLVSLMCRLQDPTSGTVFIDGVDLRDYDPEGLWSRIGLVPQHGYLFTGSIGDNLRYGARSGQRLDDDEVWHALRVAAAEDFVAAAGGLSARVAQGGANFSGGQRQRLAIARAVLRRPALYLFDDASSALDTVTDARVRAGLREACGDATVLMVTQRVSVAADADTVVLLDAGRVVDVGTHRSLSATCAAYAEFAGSQTLPVSELP